MADGYTQYQQQQGPFTYTQQRLRRGTPPQTPSPTRSPAPQSPGGYLYHQSQQTHPHAMMNAQTQRNYMPQQNMTKFFPMGQPHNQQVDHSVNHVQNNAGNSSMAGGHSHSYSSGGMGGPAYSSPQHVSNGTPNNLQNNSQHWQEQLALASTSRASSSPHHHARQVALLNKNSSAQVTGGVNPSSYQPINGQHRKDGPPADVSENRKGENGEIERQDWKALDLGGQGLRALSNALFQYTFLDKLYINHNKLTELPSAIGRLKLLQLLDASGNQLTELPPELGMLTNLKTLYVFDNQLHDLPFELGSLYQLEVLGIEGNPMQPGIMQTMAKDGTRAVIINLRENMPVSQAPVGRDWIVLDDTTTKNDAKAQADKFQVLCYNILCEKYATPQMYGYAPSWVVAWDYRKDMIKEQLLESKADIICLQEVDWENYSEFFAPQLAIAEYKGVFYPKSRAKTMNEHEKKSVDGCATFVKTNKFIILDKQVIDFSSSAIQREDMKKTADIYNRVMPKDNIAVITFIENKQTGSRMIVANVHIFWDPQFRDVKLVQVAMLMEELSKYADKWAKLPRSSNKAGPSRSEVPDDVPAPTYANGSSIPLIICGDFNSIADSGVYELLSRGAVASDHDDLKDRVYGNFTKDGMSHPFSLKSSYSNIGELKFTNYTPTFTGVIDYIWYTMNNLNVSGLMGDVDVDYLARVPGFPNVHFPSDHILLQAEFTVKPPRKEIVKPPPPDFGPSSSRKS